MIDPDGYALTRLERALRNNMSILLGSVSCLLSALSALSLTHILELLSQIHVEHLSDQNLNHRFSNTALPHDPNYTHIVRFWL